MPLYQGKGIVLRSLEFGESDRLVTFLSRDWGKIKAICKNARKVKSRFLASLTPLNYVEIVFFGRQGRSLFRLNACEIVNPLSRLRSDLEAFLAALYLVDIVEALSPEGEANEPVFQLLLEVLNLLPGYKNPGPLLRFFEIRFLDYLGYRFETEKCLHCKNTCKPRETRFNPTGSGLVCAACSRRDKEAIAISASTLNFIKMGLQLPVDRSLRLKLNPTQQKELEHILHLCLRHHAPRSFLSKRFLGLC